MDLYCASANASQQGGARKGCPHRRWRHRSCSRCCRHSFCNKLLCFFPVKKTKHTASTSTNEWFHISIGLCRVASFCAAAAVRPVAWQQQRSTRHATSAGGRRPTVRVHAADASAPAASAADIAALNKEFGIPERVEIKAGLGGLPTVVLKHACGSSAEVCLFGGCITSWKQASGDEVLYMRPDALKVLQSDNPKSKPISGGIPHCFPQVRCPGPCP